MCVCLKVWELSDLDRDGMLDKDEFSVVRCELISRIEKKLQRVQLQSAVSFSL